MRDKKARSDELPDQFSDSQRDSDSQQDHGSNSDPPLEIPSAARSLEHRSNLGHLIGEDTPIAPSEANSISASPIGLLRADPIGAFAC